MPLHVAPDRCAIEVELTCQRIESDAGDAEEFDACAIGVSTA
jgi:hypothetical protein